MQLIFFLGTEINDLEGNGAAFDADVASWTVAGTCCGATSPYTTNCAGDDILGGFSVLSKTGSFTRTYSGLPGHDIIYV